MRKEKGVLLRVSKDTVTVVQAKQGITLHYRNVYLGELKGKEVIYGNGGKK